MADRDELPPDRANRIADAVEAIERDVLRLRELRGTSRDEYGDEDNQDLRDAVERKFEKLAEATLDVANQIVEQEGRRVTNRRKATIDAIEELGVVEPELADRLRRAVAFRDVLAHTYGPIVNDDLVYNALQNSLDRYVEFVEAVDTYLSRFDE